MNYLTVSLKALEKNALGPEIVTSAPLNIHLIHATCMYAENIKYIGVRHMPSIRHERLCITALGRAVTKDGKGMTQVLTVIHE